jgi:hypothetical protein
LSLTPITFCSSPTPSTSRPALDAKHITFDETRIEGVETDRQRVVLQNGDALH